jgi:hypothetical protein
LLAIIAHQADLYLADESQRDLHSLSRDLLPFNIASCALPCALVLISTLGKRIKFTKDRQASEAESTMGSYFSKSWDPSTGIPDLSGKVVIVTGAKFVIDPDRSC